MRNESPVAAGTFGWGKTFSLYSDYLEVNGKHYALTDLTYMRPIYQRVMGISSVRLELRFEKKKVTLRGIAALEEAQKVIDYLTPTLNWQRFREEQREHRERRLHVERSFREHGFDVEKLTQLLKQETLPTVAVPVRLLPGEQAHYSTEATLCGEPIGQSIRYTYPAKDHGTLMLTNMRMIYIGRKSQIVLDYARLLHVSRLRSAVAFQAEHWYRREIFEVHRPLECTMYMECILQRFHAEELGPTTDEYPQRMKINQDFLIVS